MRIMPRSREGEKLRGRDGCSICPARDNRKGVTRHRSGSGQEHPYLGLHLQKLTVCMGLGVWPPVQTECEAHRGERRGKRLRVWT